MIRLTGVLTGAALAIALLLLLLGVPEIGSPPDLDDTDTYVAGTAAPETTSEPEAPVDSQPEPAALQAADPEPLPQTDSEPAAQPEPEPPAATEPPTSAEEPAHTDPQPEADAPAQHVAAETATQNWYAFWSPFNSRIAAEGFVSELSRTTGLDYRVVKLKPGVYEVAVAYTDNTDIEDKLMLISAATGLDMSGG